MLRAIGLILGLALYAALLVVLHGYVVQRLVWDPAWPAPVRVASVMALGALALLLFAQPVGERLLPPARQRWVAWPASLWMGVAFYLLIGLGVTELAFALLGAEVAVGSDAARARALGVLGVATGVSVVALRIGLRSPVLREEHFEVERWPARLDGYRIVQITDIHIGPILDRHFAAHLVERVNALEPDLVAVTGDLVDGPVHHLEDEVAPFAGLRSRHGVFFVTGNHDHLSHAPSWVPQIEKLGMQVLRNRHLPLGDGDDGFDLVGVDDHHARFIGGGASDLDCALAGRDPERPAVLLAHDPSTYRAARHREIDLQISGHTHGGQLWPFAALVRVVIPWVAGRYREGRPHLYVSRGTGFWGPPMRLFAPAEITQIEIRTPSE